MKRVTLNDFNETMELSAIAVLIFNDFNNRNAAMHVSFTCINSNRQRAEILKMTFA